MLTLTWITTLVVAYCLGKWQADRAGAVRTQTAIAETQQRWMKIASSAFNAGIKKAKETA